MAEPPRPFTPDQLAERWQCSAETVRQLARRGELPSFRVGKMYRFPKSAVEEYEARLAEPLRRDPTPTWDVEAVTIKHARPRGRAQDE